MTEHEPADPPPPGVDPTVPSPARMWNYWVGGTDHYAVEPEAAGVLGGYVAIARKP